MIHEHDALELASAALDFPLTGEEEARLEEAIAECPICAERAAVYRRHAMALAQLPMRDASEATRRRIAAAATQGRRTSERTYLLLAAALLLMLALATAAVGSRLFRAETPLVSDADAKESTPSSTVEPSPPPAPPAQGGLRVDALAEVVVDDLSLRSAPSSVTGAPVAAALARGDRLFVASGPVIDDAGDAWYEVITLAAPDAGPSAVGWARSKDAAGVAQIAEAAPACPVPPVDIVALEAMHGLHRLACFADRPMSFTAVVGGGQVPRACDPGRDHGCIDGPTWLAGVGGWSADASSTRDPDATTSGLLVRIAPGGVARDADLPAGRVVLLEGSFDHADARTCAAGGSADPAATLDDSVAVLACRARFSVTRATPDPNSLAANGVAVTVSSDLRVRSLPLVADRSRRLTPLLDIGTRLHVIGGPTIGSGYAWYEVVVPTVANDDGMLVGWVASGSRTGEKWVDMVDLACPPADAPIPASELARVMPGTSDGGGLACFGDETILVASDVALQCIGSTTPILAEPAWLALPLRMIGLTSSAGTVRAVAHPSLELGALCETPPFPAVVEGHFDDPEARDCEVHFGPTRDDPRQDPRVSVHTCATEFVVTAIRPAD